MAQIVLGGLEDELVASLEEQAKEGQRSLEGEVRSILEDAVRRRKRHRHALEEIERLHGKFSGRKATDSVELLREARAEQEAKWDSL